MLNISNGLKSSHPWLRDIPLFFIENISQLIDASQTFVHGEFYPNHILYNNGDIYPVDWESASFALGEIDLASLIEGYGDNDSQSVLETYASKRWPGRNMHFNKKLLGKLNIARFHFHMRWIGRYTSLDVWEINTGKMNKLLKRLSNLKTVSLELNHN